MAVSSSKKMQYGCLLISHGNNFWKFPMEWTALPAMLTLSRGVQLCTHANSTLCSTRYWLVPLVTGLFLASSACYWLVPLVTGLFRLFRVLETQCFGSCFGNLALVLPGSKLLVY